MAASTDSGTSEPSAAQASTSAAASGSRSTRNAIRFDSDMLSFGGKRKASGASGPEMDDDEDDEDKGKPGRRKIDIEYIQDKSKRVRP